MKKIILIFIILIIAVFSMNKFGILLENTEKIKGNGLKAVGEIYLEGNWIYFTNFYDNGLYRINKNDRPVDKVSNEKNVIRVVGNDIYYMHDDVLCKENIDTGKRDRLNIRGEVLYIDNNIILYENSKSKYCFYDFSENKTNELLVDIKIDKTSYPDMLDFEDGWLYFANYQDQNKLYKLNIYDQSIFKISEHVCVGLCVSDGIIYYTNADDNFTLYRIDSDGENHMKLNDKRYTFYFKVHNNIIYYHDYSGGEIYKMDCFGNNDQKITNDKSVHFCVDDNFVYYSKMIENIENDMAVLESPSPEDLAIIDEINSIYKISVDGGTAQKWGNC